MRSPLGRQSKVFYGNGVVDQKDYFDHTGNFRLKTIKTWKGTVCSPSTTTTCYQDLLYASYDGVGNLVGLTDNRFPATDGRHRTETNTTTTTASRPPPWAPSPSRTATTTPAGG